MASYFLSPDPSLSGATLAPSDTHAVSDLPGTSYLNTGRETISLVTLAQSFLSMADPSVSRELGHLEYGLYLHLVRDALHLVTGTRSDMAQVVELPWSESASVYLSGCVFPPDPTPISDSTLSSSLVTALRMFDVHSTMYIHVLQGSVQDLIATRITTILPTLLTPTVTRHIRLAGGERRSDQPLSLKFICYRAERIHRLDFEIIMRAKMSECLELSTPECCALLDPLVPTALLERFRSEAALVDWSLLRRRQHEMTDGTPSEPSSLWGSIRRLFH
jgi:hypothetical protein